MNQRIFFLLLLLGWFLASGPLAAQEAAADRAKAYELYQQKRYTEAAEAFQTYVGKNPDDTQAALDLASLLDQLNRHAESLKVLEDLHQKNPQHEAAYFKLGVQYVALHRPAEAERVFSELEKSSNADMARAATESLQHLRADAAHEEQLKAEQGVFALADKFEHQQVIEAVAALEQRAPLSFGMQMQRLYSLDALHQYAPALERANRLAVTYPAATDLALLRAELLAELGRVPEAVALWRQIERDNAGTEAAAKAARRRIAAGVQEEEEKIFDLARQHEYREVVTAVGELEKKEPVPFAIEMQRLYAWQGLGDTSRALGRAGELATLFPASSELALFRADLYAQQGQWPQAEKVLRRITNEQPGTLAAFEAGRRIRAETARLEKNRAEEKIFSLARQQKNLEVTAAIDDLEKKGKLPWVFELQRLYAWGAVGQTSRALERADQLAGENPKAFDLALVRAKLLVQAGRRDDATQLLKRIEQENSSKPVAAEAAAQLAALNATARPSAEEHVYELANQQKYHEVVAAIDELEKQGPLSLPMGMQRLYALQALGDKTRVETEAAKLYAANPQSTDVALLRAELLVHQHKWEEASAILKQIKKDHAGTPVAAEADQRLQSLPPIADLDKWYWGEAYNSGDYHGRFGALIGSGFERHGYFIPDARWIQPYAEFRYSVDTKSSVTGQRTIVADNFVAFSGGVRLQPLPTEYLFVYASGGINKDLLGVRDGGDWAGDYEAGIYGFKSWGPGTVLLRGARGGEIAASGGAPAFSTSDTGGASAGAKTNLVFWRGDWFVDTGADFSYYYRYRNAIGYGQAHEGFRLFQVGPHSAIDAYAVENISWDVQGDYFDNLIEIGPGARWLWVPHHRCEVVLRVEYLNGFYFGRDNLNTRNGAPGQYGDFHVGLSVGVRW